MSISENQRIPLPEANWIGTIYHGLPQYLFRPSFEPGSYLAFLGRLTAEKGPEPAIRIARAVGIPLQIAAKVPRGETTYFKECIEPQVDGQQVRLIGEVNDHAKQGFLAAAAALLFPIDWPEPFGLVMIEAMASGTPMLAFPGGSVPEIIEDGLTGYIVSNIEEAVQAIPDLLALDRKAIRARFEQRFSGAWQRTTLEYTRCSEGTPPRKSSSPLPPCQRPRR